MYVFFIKKQGVSFEYHLYNERELLCHWSVTFPKHYQVSIDYLYAHDQEPFT